MVHVSAIGADGNSPSLYGRSKAAAEQAVLAAQPAATIMRPSILFGPEDDFFNRFAGLARMSPALPLIGGGATRFQPVFVGDVGRALAAMVTGSAAGQTYELGGPGVFSFRELMETTDWDSYGTGKYEKCADCMVHCGYEGTAVADTVARPAQV